MGLSPSGGDGSRCRGCGAAGVSPFLDLGRQPLGGDYPFPADAQDVPGRPLVAGVCRACWLVQLIGRSAREAHLPGAPTPLDSETMADHARRFVAEVVDRDLPRGEGGPIIEVASHAGYLQPFFQAGGRRSTIVEADPVLRRSAESAGRWVRAWPRRDGRAAGRAALVVDHYLLAHRRSPRSTLADLAGLLASDGRLVLEFDHLLPAIVDGRLDGFRHGHFSYLTLTALRHLLDGLGIVLVDASPQPVYGGALRVRAVRASPSARVDRSVGTVLDAERAAGLSDIATYAAFADRATEALVSIRAFLEGERDAGRRVLGYGAPARATTLLNAGRIGPDLLSSTADRASTKQGRAVPGVGVPIVAPEALLAARPDAVLILAWDLAPEIARQLAAVRSWGGRLIVPLPDLAEIDAEGRRRRLPPSGPRLGPTATMGPLEDR